ncbi:MAG: ComEC/Rec2 family competence protein [Propionibacteriaceae bacterium]|nr:ComEC/Rec2 family competence protein [Propionibacteriaceae bacterium]
MTGSDWRPVVLAAVAWVGTFAGTGGASGWWVLASVAALVAASWCAKRRHWFGVAVALVLAVAAGVAGLRVFAVQSTEVAQLAHGQAIVTVTGVVGLPRLGATTFAGKWWTAVLEVEHVAHYQREWDTSVRVQLFASGGNYDAWAAVTPGAKVRAQVKLDPPDGDFSVAAVARAREPPTQVTELDPVSEWVELLHAGLREASSGLAPRPRAMVPALVLGDTAEMDEVLREQFVTTGLTHLTAVSGANLTILLACLMSVAVRLGVQGWRLRAVAGVGVVCFVLLCRGEPSVLRAAAMGTVALVSLGWSARGQGLRYLGVSVLGILLVDPFMARSVGFALSVAATFGIIVWANRWAERMPIPLWLAAALCVPVAAQLATQPIIAWLSGQVSIVGVFANLAAGPLVAPATVMGCLAVVFATWCLPLAQVCATVAGWFANGLCLLAEFAASSPGAKLDWPTDAAGVATISAICVAIVLLLRLKHGVIGLLLTLSAWLVVTMVVPPTAPGWPPAQWQLVVCAVGQGDAAVFNAGAHHAVLIDAGPDVRELDSCLDSLSVQVVDLLVVTHLHADHTTGVPALWDGRTLRKVVYSGVQVPQSGWQQLRQDAKDAEITTAGVGSVFEVGDVRLEIVSGPTSTSAENLLTDAQQNDASLVSKVQVGELTVLAGGDVEEAGQRYAAAVADLRADVMLMPHHGSARGADSYWDATQASIAIASAGVDNPYGHPTKTALDRAYRRGMRIYRTDQRGPIAVSKAGGEIMVTARPIRQ